MKKVLLFIVVISLLLLTSCSFVKYVDVQQEDNKEIIVSAIEQNKEECYAKICELSSEDLYRDDEKRLYKRYLVDAKAEIVECETVEELDQLYEKYEALINSLLTKAQHEYLESLEYAQENGISIIQGYVNVNDYRDEERAFVSYQIERFINLINMSNDIVEIDELTRLYITTVASIKTDKEYYTEELAALKKNVLFDIKYYKNKELYRETEKQELTNMIATFSNQISESETKEFVTQLFNSFKQQSDLLKTDAVLYEEERVALVEDSYLELLSLVNLDAMTESQKQDYLEHCDTERQTMMEMPKKEQIQTRLIQVKEELYIEGAQNGDAECLVAYQNLLTERLSYYVDLSLYRDAQKAEIQQLIEDGTQSIVSQTDYSSTVDAFNGVEADIDLIKTNEEMWQQEDSDFISNLNTSYGDDILDFPTSLTEANSYSELATIIDYYAYYQIDSTSFVRDKFRVKLNWATKDAEYEKNEIYWYCELIRFAVGMDVWEENDYFVFQLIPYDFASIHSIGVIEKISNLVEYKNESALVARDSSFDDFNYKTNATHFVVCWNSQQLWYALEHNYEPLCVSGSMAETLLNNAKTILRTIIKEGMSDEQKIFEIYKWCGHNWDHDSEIFNQPVLDDAYEHPDAMYSLITSACAEGGLIDNAVVCSSAAKAFLILLKIEGIDAVRILEGHPLVFENHAISGKDYGTIGSHELVYIKLDEQWYYCDPLYAIEFNNTLSVSRLFLPITWAPWPTKMTGYGNASVLNKENYKNLCYKEKCIFVENASQLDDLVAYFISEAETNSCISILFDLTQFDAYNYFVDNYNIEMSYLYYRQLGEMAIFK